MRPNWQCLEAELLSATYFEFIISFTLNNLGNLILVPLFITIFRIFHDVLKSDLRSFFALWLLLIFHVTIVSKPYNCLNIIIGKWLLTTFCELDVKKVLSSLSIRFIEFFFFFFSSVPDKTPALLIFLLILHIWKWSDKSAYINLFLAFGYIPNYWKICCQLVSWLKKKYQNLALYKSTQ